METKKILRPRRLYEQPEKEKEYINVKDLEQWIKEHPKQPSSFKPGKVFYNETGELLEVWWNDVTAADKVHSENVEDITIYRNILGQIVGCQIHNPKQIMGLKEVMDND